MTHYYNEHDAYRAAVLRERMDEGLLPKGVVDERDIEAIPDEDFLGYTQIHLFAGIGGFPLGLRLAGFSEERRIVTGGFPCQDISNAGKRAGITGSRSRLWREMVRCVRVVRPELVFVENVAALLGRGMGVVLGDLAEIGYDAVGDCVSAADVGAPHLRRRIWIVAHAIGDGIRDESIAERWSGGAAESEHAGEVSDAASLRGASLFGDESHGDVSRFLADAGHGTEFDRTRETRRQISERPSERLISGDCCEEMADASGSGLEIRAEIQTRQPAVESGCETVANAEEHAIRSGLCAGESRWQRRGRSGNGSRWPVEPNVGRVAHGIPKRVDRLAALGDAIVPQCAAEAVKRLTSAYRKHELGEPCGCKIGAYCLCPCHW